MAKTTSQYLVFILHGKNFEKKLFISHFYEIIRFLQSQRITKIFSWKLYHSTTKQDIGMWFSPFERLELLVTEYILQKLLIYTV